MSPDAESPTASPQEPRPAKLGRGSAPALRVRAERYLRREAGEGVETPEEM